MEIKNICEAIREKKVQITDHADEESAADRLHLDDIFYSIYHGEIIEHYSTDRQYPSCLIFGSGINGDPFTVFGRIMKKTVGLS